MPPTQKVQREDIIQATYELVKQEGLNDVNARKIAKALHCSVQPIYHNFTDMEALKVAVVEEIRRTYLQYMQQGAQEEKAYLGMGMSYIRFARDYPNFFKILFMSKSGLSADTFIQEDDAGNGVLQNAQKFSGLDMDAQKKFHLKIWVFTHGLAVLAAEKTVNFTDEEIKELLGSTTRKLLMGFKNQSIQEEP